MNVMTRIETAAPVSHTVPTDLGRLHVLETGTGQQTIVLWPSIFTDHQIYYGLVARLGRSYRFLLIDGPAHGQSEGGDQEFTMEACAQAMAQVLDQFGLERAIIGGTSWGAITAAHLALAAPARVSALLLMNCPTEIDANRPGLNARLISWGARWLLRSGPFGNGIAKRFFTPEVLNQNPAYADTFHAMLAAANSSRLATAVRSVILRGSPLLPLLPDVTVPTLIVAGKEDAMYPVAVQEKAALSMQNSHFAAVGGKHISVIEQPDDVAAVIARFIAGEVTEGPI